MPLITIHVYDDTHRHRRKHVMPLESIGPISEQHLPIGPPGEPMNLELTDSQQGIVGFGTAVDKKHKPTSAQKDSLAAHSSDETVAVVAVLTESPVRISVVAGDPGVCEVWVTGDADQGDGVKEITSEKVSVQVKTGEASGFAPATVDLGEITEQP